MVPVASSQGSSWSPRKASIKSLPLIIVSGSCEKSQASVFWVRQQQLQLPSAWCLQLCPPVPEAGNDPRQWAVFTSFHGPIQRDECFTLTVIATTRQMHNYSDSNGVHSSFYPKTELHFQCSWFWCHAYIFPVIINFPIYVSAHAR